MDVNSIPGDVISLTLRPLKPATTLNQSAEKTPSTNDQASIQMATASAVDANSNTMVSPVSKQTPDEGIESNNEPARTMNHVVVMYNKHGDVRIKFMDSKNNVIYQIPSEMAAKIEDQMVIVGTTSTNKV